MLRDYKVFLQDVVEAIEIDIDIVWDIVQNKLPELKLQIETVLGDSGGKQPPP